ncbi:MAG: DNA polymerase III subunit beta [Deltaproteobacteria bacterium]|jgi:DNA polymerase-3 subunit beta|nr:DNA polymerase III subunit beta [Deltaproteobacteria bacterium]
MYCILNKEQIIDGLQKAAGILPARTGAAYLRSLWLKAENGMLTLMSTDASIEFTGSYPVDVQEEGLAGVNGRAFVDLLRKLPQGELCMKLDPGMNTLLLEQGRRTYKLPISDATWFQPLSAFPAEGAVVWSGDFFHELIDRVLFCISDDETADAIACMYLKPREDKRIDVCGLNGHQFAVVTFAHDALHACLPPEGLLTQKKYIAELRKWLGTDEIELNITDKRLFLRSGDGRETVSLPRSGHMYPDYSTFLSRLSGESSTVSKLFLNRQECQEALDRLSIFNTDNDRCTYFELHAGEIVLSAQGQDTGSATESLEVTYDGSIERIAFPTRNMMEILAHYQSERLNLTLTGAEGPCGINGPDDADYTVLIMPMKIADQQYYEPDDN